MIPDDVGGYPMPLQKLNRDCDAWLYKLIRSVGRIIRCLVLSIGQNVSDRI